MSRSNKLIVAVIFLKLLNIFCVSSLELNNNNGYPASEPIGTTIESTLTDFETTTTSPVIWESNIDSLIGDPSKEREPNSTTATTATTTNRSELFLNDNSSTYAILNKIPEELIKKSSTDSSNNTSSGSSDDDSSVLPSNAKRALFPSGESNSIQKPSSIPALSKGAQTKEDNDDIANYVAPLYIRKNFPYYLAGYDQERRPVYVCEMGKHDLRTLVERGEEAQAQLLKFCDQAAYNIIRSIKEQSTEDFPVHEAVFLIDFEGFQLRQLTSLDSLTFLLKLARQHTKTLLDHMAVAYVVNASFLAEQLINIVSPAFGPLMARVEVFGTNRQKWMPKIRQEIGDEILPSWYGGSKDFRPIAVYGR